MPACTASSQLLELLSALCTVHLGASPNYGSRAITADITLPFGGGAVVEPLHAGFFPFSLAHKPGLCLGLSFFEDILYHSWRLHSSCCMCHFWSASPASSHCLACPWPAGGATGPAALSVLSSKLDNQQIRLSCYAST